MTLLSKSETIPGKSSVLQAFRKVKWLQCCANEFFRGANEVQIFFFSFQVQKVGDKTFQLDAVAKESSNGGRHLASGVCFQDQGSSPSQAQY